MRKQANRWLVAVFLLFFIFSGIHMTAFGEEPAKDPLAQLEEEMGIGEEIQRIQEYLDGLRPEGICSQWKIISERMWKADGAEA